MNDTKEWHQCRGQISAKYSTLWALRNFIHHGRKVRRALAEPDMLSKRWKMPSGHGCPASAQQKTMEAGPTCSAQRMLAEEQNQPNASPLAWKSSI